ncbi:alpha/beta hydrolase [Actinosynnema pretiosum]|uniref:Alpha/beta hydrolase n=1 Tax=Actinosynnema pretiosum TaxID=42197 RepID=A0A290Z972_9PSEU|nr:alpha/beta hydrolase [Actinosynnema pretiosum]ATE55580.1 alpha/beta hydrolase [Actinosynnema pretiosum]
MVKRSLLVAAALLAVTLTPATALAHPVTVRTADYDLGDAAFHVPGFHASPVEGEPARLADLELVGRVHYPADLARRGKLPLVLIQHGLWHSCADRDAEAAWKSSYTALYGPDPVTDPAEVERLEGRLQDASVALSRWPCAAGTPALPNHRGYDYLGRALAERGFVVVSIGVSGVNAGELGQIADLARAEVGYEHLRMWRRLAEDGTGPLAEPLGRLGFTGHVDLGSVGVVGHSRGGRAVMWQAARANRDRMPEGVAIRAVVPLASVTYYAPDEDAPENLDYRVTDIPFGALAGSCDYATGGPQHFANARGHNSAQIALWEVRGANHNAYNTEWSPSSGQVMATDDAAEAWAGGPSTRPGPGQCAQVADERPVRQLTEPEQRQVAVTYLSAFFAKHLKGDRRFDRVVDGTSSPLAHLTPITVSTDPGR